MQIDRRFVSWKNRTVVLAGITAFLSAFYLLTRSFWFDEVLTVQLLTNLPFSRIYYAYEIPNNHIVFTLLEKLWYDAVMMPLNSSWNFLRLVPAFCGVISAVLLAQQMIRRTGLFCGGLVVLTFVISMTFALFASAVRGYILGFLLVILFFGTAEKWVRHPSFSRGIFLFLWSLLCIGCAPTNLAGMAGVILFYLPTLIRRKAWKRLSYLGLIPFAALILFYLPILEQFLGCIRLREGWHSGIHAAGQLYGVFFLTLIWIVPFALAGAVRIWRRVHRLRWNVIAGVLIFLLPAGVYLIFPIPPFPRVFFPLFALWLVLTAYSLNGFFRHQKKMLIFLLPLLQIQIVTSLLMLYSGAVFFSGKLFPDVRTDDILAPYYVRKDFQPAEILRKIQDLKASGEKLHVFVTFDADAPAVFFEAAFMDFPEDILLMDHLNNGKKMDHFPQLPGKKYIVSSTEKDLERTMKRFGFTQSRNFLICGGQRLDLVE